MVYVHCYGFMISLSGDLRRLQEVDGTLILLCILSLGFLLGVEFLRPSIWGFCYVPGPRVVCLFFSSVFCLQALAYYVNSRLYGYYILEFEFENEEN